VRWMPMLLLVAAMLPACPRPSGPVESEAAPPASAAVEAADPRLELPSGTSARVPFVLWLHGLGSSGGEFMRALGVAELARARRFAYAAPDGSFDSKQRRFWNATDACCNLDRQAVDHVADLGRLIAAARAHPGIDPDRIYVLVP
jgi:polyhydroxybutyrate depolymerase